MPGVSIVLLALEPIGSSPMRSDRTAASASTASCSWCDSAPAARSSRRTRAPT